MVFARSCGYGSEAIDPREARAARRLAMLERLAEFGMKLAELLISLMSPKSIFPALVLPVPKNELSPSSS